MIVIIFWPMISGEIAKKKEKEKRVYFSVILSACFIIRNLIMTNRLLLFPISESNYMPIGGMQ